MRRFLFYGTLFFIFFNYSCQKPTENNTIIGVKVYDHEGDLEELFEEWNRMGINLILASPELAGKDNFMLLAHSNEKRVFLIVPTFFNSKVLDQDSSLYAVLRTGDHAIDDWVRFICPNKENYRIAHIEYLKKLVRDIHPDGISIDFIRYFVFWEKVYPDQIYENFPQTCFEDDCLLKFQTEYNVAIPDSCADVKSKADFLLHNFEREWVDFKCKTISGFVKEMSEAIKEVNPQTIINFHAVPWKSNDFEGAVRSIAGQDLKMIVPYVDFISPMCYYHMVIRSPEWIHEVVNDFHIQVPQAKLLPSIQVSKAYLETSISEVEFSNALVESLKPPSAGVIFWSWEELEESPEKTKIVRDYLKETR